MLRSWTLEVDCLDANLGSAPTISATLGTEISVFQFLLVSIRSNNSPCEVEKKKIKELFVL